MPMTPLHPFSATVRKGQAGVRTARVCFALALVAAAVLVSVPATSAAGAGAHSRPRTTLGEGQVIRDVTYKTFLDEEGEREIKLDVYLPPGVGPWPAVLVIHGAWDYSNKGAFAAEAKVLRDSGFVAVAADYRAPCDPLNPGHTVPYLCGNSGVEATADMLDAIQWIRDHAADYHVIPTAVGALGGSGGALIALTLGTKGIPGGNRPDAVVSWSGFTELWKWEDATSPSRMQRAMEDYVGPYGNPCSYEQCTDRWHDLSPITHVGGEPDAPTYMANGSIEVTPLQGALNMAEALHREGGTYWLRVVPGNTHSKKYEADVIDICGTTVFRETVDFLETNLGAPPIEEAEPPLRGPLDPPDLTIDDVSILEGQEGIQDLIFTAHLSEPADAPTGFFYDTVDGDATAGTDHAGGSGKAEFLRGRQCVQVRVPIYSERLKERDETFEIRLRDALNADLVDGTGVGTILNDDTDIVVLDFEPSSAQVGEQVTVHGIGFSLARHVTFNGVLSTFTVVSDTEISTQVPRLALTGPLAVSGRKDAGVGPQAFRVRPKIKSVSPEIASWGEEIVIQGVALSDTARVTFGGGVRAEQYTVESYNSVRVVIPHGARDGRIILITPGGTGTTRESFDVINDPGSPSTLR